MKEIISIVLFLIFSFLSFIHFYWGFGGKWGSQSVFPTKNKNEPQKMPGSIPTFIVAISLLAIGFFFLIEVKLIHFSLPNGLQQFGLWTIGAIFIIRAIGDFNYVGFSKKIKHTKFGINDTKYYSPLCLLIGNLSIILELLK